MNKGLELGVIIDLFISYKMRNYIDALEIFWFIYGDV